MPMQLTPTRTQTGEAALIIGVAPEACDAVALMRNFKRHFPQEWRQVNYEIIPPTPQDNQDNQAIVNGHPSRFDGSSVNGSGNASNDAANKAA